jgi:electron transfer flavoprotein beta subunit
VTPEAGKVTAERNLGDSMVVTESTLPALITVTKEINTPRLPSLMQILGSAKKPINIVKAETMGVADLAPRMVTEDVRGVAMVRKNIVYKDDLDAGVASLADNLAKDGVLG